MYSPAQKRGKKLPPPQKIKVICRVRPFLAEELYDDTVMVEGNCVKITNKRKTNENFVYSFHSCYGMDAGQPEIFENDVKPLLEPVLNGKNATIFAYGVTGSGKTYTIQGTETRPGIIPRTVQTLFEIKGLSKYSLDLRLSYIEIYKEVINDLLVPRDTAPSGGLTIRQGFDNQIYLPNLTEKKINTYEEFKKIFRGACRNRSTAATKLNIMSSRSHADMCIYISCTNNETKNTIFSKLHLIDLAGSEDNRRTENGKERIAESGAINKSLFALNQVVEALNQGLSRIPYRDSKLTRLLQDSLGGENISMMIINISPGQSFYADTYNTLNFATRTKEIENKPQSNHCASSTRQPLKVKLVNENNDLPEARRQRFNLSSSTSTISSTASYELRPPLLSKTEMEKIIETKLDEKLSEIEDKIKTQSSQILSPIFRKQNAKLKKRIESLEYKIELQKESRLANVLTPETKTKTARALVALAKAHELKNELGEALSNYESAFQYIPDNQKLGNKIIMIRDAIPTSSEEINNLNAGSKISAKDHHSRYLANIANDERRKIAEAMILSIVNSGDVKQILKLKGVGKKRADVIHQFIKENGHISEIYNLRYSGMSDKIIDGIINSYTQL
ncbi:3900_t:CDS:10 [Ambispora leptoticha]|uniref:Kinesin-like protein n=1 Tax=Ambispora leptoticha TaxID=144679 RepID=A0A9N9A418_9GLOM|nr:3900_t:CDS:10 [Ambispora leptoticha]